MNLIEKLKIKTVAILCVAGTMIGMGAIRATASKNLLPFAYGNAVKTSSLLC